MPSAPGPTGRDTLPTRVPLLACPAVRRAEGVRLATPATLVARTTQGWSIDNRQPTSSASSRLPIRTVPLHRASSGHCWTSQQWHPLGLVNSANRATPPNSYSRRQTDAPLLAPQAHLHASVSLDLPLSAWPISAIVPRNSDTFRKKEGILRRVMCLITQTPTPFWECLPRTA